MKLLIVESPAKAKTIEKYLDHEYTVRASVGHIRDLPKSSKNAIDIAKGFIPNYVISPGKEKIVSDLKALAKKATEVVLATDPDREGEAIAWHIKEAIGLKKSKRIVFHEITKEAVQEAIKHPREIDENLRSAQEARRVLDRLFGYDLSNLIWQKVRYGLSAGRVQSPALRILVEREKEIRAFIPEQYWVIEALLKTQAGPEINFNCNLEPKTQAEADQIVEAGQKASWQVAKVEASSATRKARAPFTTSTLQQTASSRLGFSPAITMRLAQKLYEAGHISYMRTDSTNLSDSAMAEISAVIKKDFGAEYAEAQKYTTKSKNAQEAHEAVRPTYPAIKSVKAGAQEQKLYRLIWQRTIASQMAEAKLLKTKITAQADNEIVPLFVANDQQVVFPGWLSADPEARGEDVDLPKVKEGESLKLKKIEATGKETEPPHRYSEAGLVKELEKRGIGRPSTYASTIKTIIDRAYVDKIDKALKPTETGEVVSDFLSEYFGHYISDTFTAEMEDELDEIARGERQYIPTLKAFYDPFSKDIASKKRIDKLTTLGEAPTDIKCPTCDGAMQIKLGKNGKFYSCARFPDCLGAKTMAGLELAPPKETGEACPKCKNGKLIEREGRFGKFISCNRYPKCKFIKKDEATEIANREANDTHVECNLCHKGTMIEKKGRFGIFYGCSNYPDCKNIIKAKPTGKLCELCQSLMMKGTKTIPERCSNKACLNNRPDKKAK
ncbi:MAG: DNA topoisomerase I [Candidatus Vogelbacteria bacterium CG22_combo_CG10-13_8_21_14_all_37_9]|uniref:DNA topoisomerase 1 n=1 Tax=Candidatus Vogelbacteria bacterium CG22_combo_CG10-13_8_21_14_all_37_9 TaxID=1975046 RepID=A0A2H0BL62_9BACT|nr:MAG: DNA topoisomerase I [bacterium CG10_37_50]PIP58417.1 MAG: DNA topoisomerase I [Candidatus Vogelbacteria bacterium CG22_combo_CG10-13_8_21_14_all_37_9]